jgi:predicted nucleic acid-binding protein
VKYLIDSNVYFAALRGGEAGQRFFDAVRGVMPHVWLSSVVLYELLAGARGDLGRAVIHRITRPLVRAGRLIAASETDWAEAGVAQSRIWDSMPSLRDKRLQNDILIACSARRIGAVVVTENTRDFTLIARHVQHVSLRTVDLERLAAR